MLWQLVEQFGDVAGTEDLVDVGKFLWLVGGEVRRENTLDSALSTEKLTGSTGARAGG